jgi:tetratricopeptide (TPR) repeat protein
MNAPFPFTLLVCAALGLGQAGGTKAFPGPDSPAPGVKNAGPTPTNREAQRFAAAMSRAIENRDAAAFDKLLRMRDLLARIVSDIGLSALERDAFVKGAGSTTAGKAGFGARIVQATQDGGSYRFLRVHTIDGRPRVLFRMLGAGGEVNYHDYVLVRYPDGEVAAEDIFIFMTAETFTQMIRRMIIPALKLGQGIGGGAGFDPQHLDAIRAFRNITQATQAGEFTKAVAEYRKLPKKWQQDKTALVFYMQALGRMGRESDAEFLGAVELFRKHYPDDACVDFISIDYFFLMKQFDDAFKAIERVDKALGGDPYMNVLRGNCRMEAGRLDEARALMEKAIQAEPGTANAFWARITLSLREKKHGDTLAWLKNVVEQCNERVVDLTLVPEYAQFIRSPEHGMWLTWYSGRGKQKSPSTEHPTPP